MKHFDAGINGLKTLMEDNFRSLKAHLQKEQETRLQHVESESARFKSDLAVARTENDRLRVELSRPKPMRGAREPAEELQSFSRSSANASFGMERG